MTVTSPTLQCTSVHRPASATCPRRPPPALRRGQRRAILETRHLDETARQERLEQILGELRIAHVRKSMGMALSGGERRRVEIARARGETPVLCFDEPFAGVDPLSVIDMYIMTELTAKGIGVLITDHNVRETLGSWPCLHRFRRHGNGIRILRRNPCQPQVGEVYLGQSFRM